MLLILTLCVTLGLHWGFVQSAAWVGMLLNYSRHGSIEQAVVKTFDGQHPCSLCKLVREGKKSERQSDASQQQVKKLDLLAGEPRVFHFPPRRNFSTVISPVIFTRSDVPLLRPPRAFPG